jgi:hypothetical protein
MMLPKAGGTMMLPKGGGGGGGGGGGRVIVPSASKFARFSRSTNDVGLLLERAEVELDEPGAVSASRPATSPARPSVNASFCRGDRRLFGPLPRTAPPFLSGVGASPST